MHYKESEVCIRAIEESSELASEEQCFTVSVLPESNHNNNLEEAISISPASGSTHTGLSATLNWDYPSSAGIEKVRVYARPTYNVSNTDSSGGSESPSSSSGKSGGGGSFNFLLIFLLTSLGLFRRMVRK